MSTTANLNLRGSSERATPGLVLVHSDDSAPSTIAFDSGIVIGREPGLGNIAIAQGSISRAHARLTRGRNGCAIEDLRSRNGTFVNGERIGERLLAHHDRVLVGDTLYKFVATGIEHYERLPTELPGLVGGAQLAKLVDEIRAIGETMLPVLVRGETGVGKGRFARVVHETSRRTGAFVVLDCAAIDPASFDAKVEAALGGTLVLDEVAELPLEVQAKLRRVRDFDVRLVSSTRKDLEAAVAARTFRDDVVALLHGHVVDVPPLRDRIEDVPLLVMRLLGDAPRPAASFVLAACHYHWPYNVRELENVVERARALARGAPLTSQHLPDAVRATMPALDDTSTAVSRPFRAITDGEDQAEADRAPVPDRDALLALVVEHHGNVAAIARVLKRDRALIHRWLKRHNIALETYRR